MIKVNIGQKYLYQRLSRKNLDELYFDLDKMHYKQDNLTIG